jgi:cytochrome c553
MRRLVRILALACLPALLPLLAVAADKPEWAFPVTDKEQPQIKPWPAPSAAGSPKSYTREQIDDAYAPPDWYPDMHPPMPSIVANGNKAAQVRACGLCHLPTGTGHDESAYLAGLPLNYFIRQMHDYKTGDRKAANTMVTMAPLITEQEVREAAEYFASLKPRPWIRVVESDVVPKTYIGQGNKRLRHPAGGEEPIGARIIEIPEDELVVINRDPRSGFIAYVPKGSLAKGEAMVKTGDNGKTIACTICHGPTLQGLGEVPPIAGRQATYIVRQLWNVQVGDRKGNSAALMKAVVEKLSPDDMLAIAAYTASLAP